MKFKIIPRTILIVTIGFILFTCFHTFGSYVVLQNTKDDLFTRFNDLVQSQLSHFYESETSSMERIIKDYSNRANIVFSLQTGDKEWLKEEVEYYLTDRDKHNLDYVEVHELDGKSFQKVGLDVPREVNQSILKMLEEEHFTSNAYALDNELLMLAASRIEFEGQLLGFIVIGKVFPKEVIENKMVVLDNHHTDYYLLGNKILSPFIVKTDNDEEFTVFEIETDISVFNQTLNHQLYGVAFMTILLVLLAFAYVMIHAKKLQNVVDETITNLTRVAEGDYTYRVKTYDNHELNLLSQHINKMNEQIIDNIQTIEDTHIETLSLLVNTVEAKDQYTKGHSERVAAISVLLAKEFDVNIDLVNEAALLHDIGKIGIEDTVLNKPGKLTMDEYEVIKSHSMKGKVMLSSSKTFATTGDIILQHHERYDGGGYPQGLKGEGIHQIARIITVADAFDAITSTRSYRRSMSFETGIRILNEEKGKQFDPKVVDAFMKCKDIIKKNIIID